MEAKNKIEGNSQKFSWFKDQFKPRPSGSVDINLLYKVITSPSEGGQPIMEAAEIVQAIRTGKRPKTDKVLLPVFTPAATISNNIGSFTPKKLQAYSGFTQIDIDPKDNPEILRNSGDAQALRDSLAGLNFVKLAALSASGRGVWLLVPVLDGRLKEYFVAYRKRFESIGIKVDPSKGTRPNQFRYYAPDRHAILNDPCTSIDLPEPEPLPEPKPTKPPTATTDDISPIQDFNQRGDVVDLLKSRGYVVAKNIENKTRLRSPQSTHEDFNCEYDKAKNFFFVWSNHCQPFAEGQGYRPATVWALLNGVDPDNPRDLNFALREAGYGTQPKPLPF